MSTEFAGAVAVVCFSHHVLGDKTIFCHQISYARVGSTVRERILEEPRHHLVIQRLLAGIYHALQEKVALFQLVIEEKIDLTEEEILYPQILHGTVAQDIGPREQPAASAPLLVADSRVLHFHAEVSIRCLSVFLIYSHLLDAVAA